MCAKKLFVLLLGLSLAGCASGTAPPGQLLPPRPQVRVMNAPVVSPSQITPPDKAKPDAREVDLIEERGIEVLATALKGLPTRPRQPRKDEKVFPIELNLQNADLVEAVRALADTLNLNYNIDPAVKGTVNVRASGRLTRSELLSILETMLMVNGAALVKIGNTYNILPLDKAAGQAAPVYSRTLPAAGMTAMVAFLTQTPAKDMAAVLKPFLSPGGKITETPDNSLIIVDYPANLEKLVNLIHLADTQGLARTSVSVIKVKNTDPNSIISEMEVIFSAYGALTQKGAGGVHFLAIPRMNAVMIIAASSSLLDRAKYWVQQLDLKTDTLANVHVYHVKNYKARNLADLLSQAYGAPAVAPAVREVKPELVLPSDMIGAPGTGFGSRGEAATRLRGENPELGRRESMEPGLGALGLAAPSPRERAVPLAPGAPTAPLAEGVRIIPDEENNLLVIVAPLYEWSVISQLLEKLDLMPRQVLCEVLIADVTLTDDLRYGIEWFLNTRQVGPPGSTFTPPGFPAAPNITALEILQSASAALQGAGGFAFMARDARNTFRATLNFLAAEGKVEVLAAPHIMAANNQEARIQIGQDVPILVAQSTAVVTAPAIQTNLVEYRSVGIILGVRPQINAKGLITLEIVQEVSNVSTIQAPGTVATSPTFDVRQAKTQLITGDNQTIVLGGLIREDVQRGASGFPGLRRMPLLGPLFGSEISQKRRTELIVLITPHIVDTLEQGARLTREVEQRIELGGIHQPGLAPSPAESGATGVPYQATPAPPPATPMPPSATTYY
jgi:general secretion pathway protein D